MPHPIAGHLRGRRRTTCRTFPLNYLAETFFVALELLCSLEKALPEENLPHDRVVKRQSSWPVVESPSLRPIISSFANPTAASSASRVAARHSAECWIPLTPAST